MAFSINRMLKSYWLSGDNNVNLAQIDCEAEIKKGFIRPELHLLAPLPYLCTRISVLWPVRTWLKSGEVKWLGRELVQ